MIYISGILILVGLFMIVKPEMVWHIAESWKTGDGTEPSDLYIWSTRFGGIMVSLAGAAGILAVSIT